MKSGGVKNIRAGAEGRGEEKEKRKHNWQKNKSEGEIAGET